MKKNNNRTKVGLYILSDIQIEKVIWQVDSLVFLDDTDYCHKRTGSHTIDRNIVAQGPL